MCSFFKQIQCTFTGFSSSSDMKRSVFTFLLFFIVSLLHAQSFKLSGKVTDAKLEPLAFATILIKDQAGIMKTEPMR